MMTEDPTKPDQEQPDFNWPRAEGEFEPMFECPICRNRSFDNTVKECLSCHWNPGCNQAFAVVILAGVAFWAGLIWLVVKR